jgi:heparin binding hemagglutinin HbhA
MAITEDLRKTLTDPTPLYAAAGGVDLAAEKLKEVPALVQKIRAEAPERIAAVRSTDPKAIQERVSQQAKEAQVTVQTRLNAALSSLDTDLKKLRDQTQELALQGVGKATEYAVKAREAYDELAERGRGAVKTWRGEAADEIADIAVAVEPEPEQQSGPEPAKAQAAPAQPSQAKKTAPARKPAAAKKTAPKSTG